MSVISTNNWCTHVECAGTKFDNRMLKWRNSTFAIVSYITPFQILLDTVLGREKAVRKVCFRNWQFVREILKTTFEY